MQVKVLMVCLGNICRSPLAEGILQSKVTPEQVLVDSCGTGGWHVGNPPDPRSIAVAKRHGLNIGSQRCRKFKVSDFKEFDHIYVMDKNNYGNIVAQAENATEISKVTLLLSEIISKEKEVPDPYYDEENGFENVYQLIDEACSAIARKIMNNTLE